MDQTRESRVVSGLLSVLLLASALGGCGSSEEKMPPATGSLLSASTPTAGLNICANCHVDVTEDWLASKHANLDAGANLYSYGSPTVGIVSGGGAACIQCHDPIGDSNNLTAGYTSAGGVKRPVVGCESCHGAGSLHADKGGVGPISLLSGTFTQTTVGSVPVSGQFVMCTRCHELLHSSGTGTADASHGVSSSVTPTGTQYTITDTHFATAGTYSVDGHNIGTSPVGYSMDFARSRVCTECHNPHTTADINREWAASGHADRNPASPWAYYNWSFDNAAGGAYGDRTTCQRCHTTTGFGKYADALASGNTALATAIWTGQSPPIPFQTDFKPEMLKCNGCHTDNRGTLRNPGAYKATYKIPSGGFPSSYPVTANVSHQYPDISASNVCMPCHTGRGSGKAIHDLNTGQTATVNFSNLSYGDGHYFSGGGTMFKGTAYEYNGRIYSDPASFRHKKIGTSAAENTGNSGPCIGCHMDRPGFPGNHRFQPVGKDATGKIVNVSSEVCFINCHEGRSALADQANLEMEDYKLALAAFDNQLIISGYTFTSYPYFKNTDWRSPDDSDITGNTTGKNNLGAAFNYSLLYHEPGAYIHNSRYAKRIVYDSIDWLDNNQMDWSVGATLDKLITETFKDGAMRYLLNQVHYEGGNIVPGPAERP